MGKAAVLVDVSRCIACRGCQVACKQWNGLPMEKTVNTGSYQNPPDLSAITYTLIRFKENSAGGKMVWTFFKDQCRHCVEPPCAEFGNETAAGSVAHHGSGAVVYDTAKTKAWGDESPDAFCPYNIPRRCKKDNVWTKCTFCADRISNGMEPACVKTCPTGALVFGDREKILALGKKRLAGLKKKYPGAMLVDADEVSWIYLLNEPQKMYDIAKNTRFDAVRYAKKSGGRSLVTAGVGLGLLGMLAQRKEKVRKEEK